MTTYTISLDDIDLALLPTRSYSNDFLKREQYEFQLMARAETEDASTYVCHICDLDVPSAFASAHNASAKHEANVLIATEATRRMRALLTAQLPRETPRAAGTFCEACVAIADKDHDKTKEHKLAVIQDRMLSDLVKLYIGDDKGDENKGIDDKRAGEDSSNVASATTDDTKNLVVANDVENEHEPIPLGNTKQTHFKLDAESYIDILMFMDRIKIGPKIELKSVGDKIEMLVNSEKIHVSHDNFHGYHRLEGKIQCRVCYTTLPTEQEETHKLSRVHITRLMQIEKDGHCIRQINDNWSHCIICNQVIRTLFVEGHKVTMMHVDKRRNATVPQTQTPGNTDDQIKDVTSAKPTFSAVASSSGIRANKNVANHVPQNNGHKYMAKPKPLENRAYKPVVQESLIEYPYQSTNKLESVFCILCKCEVPSKPSNREDHLKGYRHACSARSAKTDE